METAVFAVIFFLIILVVVFLFVYVVASKRNKATSLYKAAAALESRGNYAEAIALYETYLKENEDEGQKVGQKVKTLRSLVVEQKL